MMNLHHPLPITLDRGLAIGQSAVLHGLVVAGIWLGLPHVSREYVVDQPVLTVELVNTVPVTNLEEGIITDAPQPKREIVKGERPQLRPAPPPPPRPIEAEKPLPAVPRPSPLRVAEKPVAVPPEITPLPEPKPAAEPEPKPVAEPEPKPVAEPEPKPVAQPAAPPEEPPQEQKPAPTEKRQQEAVNKTVEEIARRNRQIALNKALQDLTRRKEGNPDAEEKQDREEQKGETKPEDEIGDRIAELSGQALNAPPPPPEPAYTIGASVVDQLRSKISNAWNPPVGTVEAHSIIVGLTVTLDEEAKVTEVKIRNSVRYNGDPVFRAAADAARRAIFDSSPLPLPLADYQHWKVLDFDFDPRFINRGG